MPQRTLDEIDRRILAALQENARISNVDLADTVGVSPSPCWRRVRELEQSGVIARYVTLVDPGAIGLPVSVFIQVSLEKQVEPTLEAFESAVLARPEVMECYLMTGEFDYLLRVVVGGSADFERVHSQHLTRLPGVDRVQSSFALRAVGQTSELPVR
ncbi:MAG: Lrp/AsnC family transcriptional regulator [Alphaproteobacteria bacterium]|nr:Lrp/AsnC family transcriptional regulator [Alphaproteobacteria bacterium]